MSEVRMITDGAALAQLLRSPTGAVGRHLFERATLVQAAARQTLAPHRRTGCLEGSLVKRFERLGPELAIRIVSDTTPCSPTRTSYSLLVHEGTRAHDIHAKPGGVLAFELAGEKVFATSVHHPGTAPVPFLRDALELIARG